MPIMIQSTFIVTILVLLIIGLYGTPSFVNPDGTKQLIESRAISSKFKALIHWELTFTANNQRRPSISDWKTEMRQSGFALPSSILDANWVYGESPSERRYWCLQKHSPNHYSIDVLSIARELLSNEGEIYLNSECGATENASAPQLISPISLTLYTGV